MCDVGTMEVVMKMQSSSVPCGCKEFTNYKGLRAILCFCSLNYYSPLSLNEGFKPRSLVHGDLLRLLSLEIVVNADEGLPADTGCELLAEFESVVNEVTELCNGICSCAGKSPATGSPVSPHCNGSLEL